MNNSMLSSSTIFNFFLVVTASLFFNSCSKTDVQNNETSKQNVNLINSNRGSSPQNVEYLSKVYTPQPDDFVQIKNSNDSIYTVKLDTKIEFRKSQTGANEEDNVYEIKNPETNEIDLVQNIRTFNDRCLFDLYTSNGDLLTDIKYLGTDFTAGLDSIIIVDGRAACPWCYVAVTIVGLIIDATKQTPLEQCASAMNSLNCPSGQSPFMNFSEGWFSTSCSVGCKR